jgi:hypothetical protein
MIAAIHTAAALMSEQALGSLVLPETGLQAMRQSACAPMLQLGYCVVQMHSKLNIV